jgi:hypothetical protein
MFHGVGSGDRAAILNVAVAKAASILQIPVVLTLISPERNAEFIGDIPNQRAIARQVPGFEAFEDEAVFEAVKQTGHQKLVVSGLWTSMCFAYSTLHGLREGFDVYVLNNAAGDATLDAHLNGLQRMFQASTIPITWMPLVSEWMHDWANPKAAQLVQEVYGKYEPLIVM